MLGSGTVIFRQALSNEPLVTSIGVETAEKEPFQICQFWELVQAALPPGRKARCSGYSAVPDSHVTSQHLFGFGCGAGFWVVAAVPLAARRSHEVEKQVKATRKHAAAFFTKAICSKGLTASGEILTS